MADEPTPSSSPSPTWAALRAGVISFVVGAGIAGGYAWYSLSQDAAAQEAELQGQIDACAGQKTALDATVASVTNDKRLLQLRVDLTRVVDALEDSNFGVAKTHLETAQAHLGDVKPAPPGAVAQGITDLSIEVTEDLESQIQRIDGLAEQLDGMLSAN